MLCSSLPCTRPPRLPRPTSHFPVPDLGQVLPSAQPWGPPVVLTLARVPPAMARSTWGWGPGASPGDGGPRKESTGLLSPHGRTGKASPNPRTTGDEGTGGKPWLWAARGLLHLAAAQAEPARFPPWGRARSTGPHSQVRGPGPGPGCHRGLTTGVQCVPAGWQLHAQPQAQGCEDSVPLAGPARGLGESAPQPSAHHPASPRTDESCSSRRGAAVTSAARAAGHAGQALPAAAQLQIAFHTRVPLSETQVAGESPCRLSPPPPPSASAWGGAHFAALPGASCPGPARPEQLPPPGEQAGRRARSPAPRSVLSHPSSQHFSKPELLCTCRQATVPSSRTRPRCQAGCLVYPAQLGSQAQAARPQQTLLTAATLPARGREPGSLVCQAHGSTFGP